jgi:FAD:protein FMN transferase
MKDSLSQHSRERAKAPMRAFPQTDCAVNSVYERRNDFQKADNQGENSFAKEFSPWTLFQKTPIRLRRSQVLPPSRGPAYKSRRQHIIGVLCGRDGGRFSCKKEAPGMPAEQEKQSNCKKDLPGIFFGTLLAATLLVASCSNQDSSGIYKSSRVLMGTFVEITLSGQGEKAKSATEAIFDEIKRIEDLTSFHKPSGLAQVNGAAGQGPFKAEPEALKLIAKSLQFAEKSRGGFDPTIGPVCKLWQFSGGGEPRLPEKAEIADALTKVGWNKVKIDPEAGTITLPQPGMALDLGGIAKGYTLDRAADVIRKLGVTSALVNIGGDVLVIGEREPGKPWRIGVQDPRDPKGIVAVAALKDTVIVTSGDYERFFIRNDKRYHHLLDPSSGYPADKLQSVTLSAPNGTTAEAVSVSVFVMGAQEGLKYMESWPGIEGFVIDSRGKILTTQGAQSVFEMKGR